MTADLAYEIADTATRRIGLVVLQSDETIEADMYRMLPSGLELMVTRVPSASEVSQESLQAMATRLSGAAALFPPWCDLAAIGYGCTSGTAQIGADQVAEAIRDGHATPRVTEPVSALRSACAALGIKQLGLVSPYVAPVSDRLRQVLGVSGIDVNAFASFGEPSEARVARIAPGSIIDAARAVAAQGGCDALFLSCTNLRTLDVIDRIEDEIGCPVLSSNQVLGWHLFALAGAGPARFRPGRLWDA